MIVLRSILKNSGHVFTYTFEPKYYNTYKVIKHLTNIHRLLHCTS